MQVSNEGNLHEPGVLSQKLGIEDVEVLQMSTDSSARTAALFLSIALISMTNPPPAFSQDLPPEPPAATTENAPAIGTEAPRAAAQTDAPEIAPGPLQEQRKKLYATIMTAKNYGFGTTAYLNAFNSLEDSVKAGAAEKDIKSRLDSIVVSLEEQLKRSQQLKVQRAAPPIAASSPTGGPSGGGGGGQFSRENIGKALQGGHADTLIEKVKNQWFGGEIPDSIKRKMPANFDPSMLNSDTAKELMKRYGGGGQ